jgi:hypothetical protein
MNRFEVLALAASVVAASACAADAAKPDREGRPGKAFFETSVVPKLAENGCPMCHAVGYVRPNVIVYADLLPYLAMGDAPEKTPVIRKIANLRAIRPDLPTHPGGQRCETTQAEPCRTIIEWWRIEFGDDAGVQGSGK